MRATTFAVFLVLVLVSNIAARGENWPRFRGPTGQGHSSESNLPVEWNQTKNVRWSTSIRGEGWSSPIVWDQNVFLTTTTDDGTVCRLVCLDLTTGDLRWDRELLQQEPQRKEQKNSYATPTPVTDGERVYAVFGDGSMVALSIDGELLWTNRDVKFYSRHGLGASPVLFDNLVIMPFDGSNRVDKAGDYPNNSSEERLGWQLPWDQALIVALDKATGERMWTARRGMSRIAHVTPILYRQDDQVQLVSPAGDCIQGFDPTNGELLWTVASQGEGVTPSPAVGDGLLFTSSGFEKTTLRTVRLGGMGNVTDSHIAWEETRGCPTQSSLIYVSPYLYAITDSGVLTCFAGTSGEMIYQGRVGGNHCASPVYADGKIYFLSEQGETTVVRAGPTFEVLARNPLEEHCQASMAISQGNLLIRTASKVYCVRQ